jgi:hypothetical protein
MEAGLMKCKLSASFFSNCSVLGFHSSYFSAINFLNKKLAKAAKMVKNQFDAFAKYPCVIVF